MIRVVPDNATYSASVEIRVTPFSSALEVKTGAEPYLTTIPLLFLLFDPTSPSQLKSAYMVHWVDFSGDDLNEISLLPLKYRVILFVVLKYCIIRLSTCNPRKLATIAISGMISTAR